MSNIQQVFIAYEADNTNYQLSIATESVDSVRRLSQSIEKGNDVWKSWCIVNGGDVVSHMGANGVVSIGADHIIDLPKIKEQYAQILDAHVSVGVGLSLVEADKALKSSHLNGGNRITFYTPEIDQELKEVEDKHHQTEEDKVYDQYLNKAEHPLQGQFEGIIQEQEQAESAKQAESEKSSQTGKMKQVVVSILQQVRANTKELEGLKQEAPHLYQSIMSLVQALIMMGRQLQAPPTPGQPQPMAKSEAVKAKHFVMHYPVGFLLAPGGDSKGGRIKVATSDGKTKWHSVRSGIIMSPDGSPTSSRSGTA